MKERVTIDGDEYILLESEYYNVHDSKAKNKITYPDKIYEMHGNGEFIKISKLYKNNYGKYKDVLSVCDGEQDDDCTNLANYFRNRSVGQKHEPIVYVCDPIEHQFELSDGVLSNFLGEKTFARKFMMYVNRKPVSYVLTIPLKNIETEYILIGAVFTKYEYRRNKYAKKLIKRVIEYYKNTDIILEVAEKGEKGEKLFKLYEQLGFKKYCRTSILGNDSIYMLYRQPRPHTQ